MRNILRAILLFQMLFLCFGSTSLFAAPKGYLNGDWQIKNMREISPTPHPIVSELLKQIQAETLSFTFSAQGEAGEFKLVSQSKDDSSTSCTITLPYDVNYCCVRMQKLFLYTSLDSESTEEPAGCAETHFQLKHAELIAQLEKIIHPSFHYYVAGEKMNQILLEGPYTSPTLQLDLERIKKQ